MSDEHRQAQKRAQYLNRTTELDRGKCLVLAYSERGYSTHGIANIKHVDVTQPTVKQWLDEIAEAYGILAVMPKVPDDRGDITQVSQQ